MALELRAPGCVLTQGWGAGLLLGCGSQQSPQAGGGSGPGPVSLWAGREGSLLQALGLWGAPLEWTLS